ncbi:uncharacterized protein LOC127809482 isoform X2 [Diospyros lotus]|uniref:uncharacterized protein LOC127809482 isoform X2 n=1 Tax=Diospyros lotus TaxID=55363 RepID=UPI0022546CB8|nr:uncharacterized protein LOC127809482 isoform X2 [Diospyros lotus]
MSLLEVIKKAATNPDELTSESNYPIVLNPDQILLSLKPQDEASNDATLIKRVQGWTISETDSEIIDSSKIFFKKLKRKLKNPNSFGKDEFVGMLNSYLKKNSDRVGISVGAESSGEDYTHKLIEKAGFLMGREVKGLVLEACTVLELWELLKTLIVHGLVESSASSSLVCNLIEKRRSDLVCLCVKKLPNLQTSTILSIFRYFLSPPKAAHGSMLTVKNEWENQAISAYEKTVDKKLSMKALKMAKEASILLMMAHDGFSVSELCLHYLIASSNLDEVILSACISKLNGLEMLSLIQYLGKWLKKYDRFPQAGPCPKAAETLGLEACEWVPTLEDIVKFLGLVLDEHFSSLVLHPEFHEELRSMEELVNSLALEVRLSCSVANVIDCLRTDSKASMPLGVGPNIGCPSFHRMGLTARHPACWVRVKVMHHLVLLQVLFRHMQLMLPISSGKKSGYHQ